MIKLENVLKSYRESDIEHTVLNNLNITIKEGEIVILYGKSGSGKSTLLNLLSGIDLPTSGSIYFDGINLTTLSEKERTLFRRKRIGFIFQFFNLIPTLTVEENLMLPLELNSIPFTTASIKSVLDEVELGHKAKSYPDKLSGGEQQRIAIARALVHEPDFVLADEPTGNLDYDTGDQIIKLLDRIVKQKGKTMVMATHSREVMGLADRVFSLKDGGLIEISKDS